MEAEASLSMQAVAPSAGNNGHGTPLVREPVISVSPPPPSPEEEQEPSPLPRKAATSRFRESEQPAVSQALWGTASKPMRVESLDASMVGALGGSGSVAAGSTGGNIIIGGTGDVTGTGASNGSQGIYAQTDGADSSITIDTSGGADVTGTISGSDGIYAQTATASLRGIAEAGRAASASRLPPSPE